MINRIELVERVGMLAELKRRSDELQAQQDKCWEQLGKARELFAHDKLCVRMESNHMFEHRGVFLTIANRREGVDCKELGPDALRRLAEVLCALADHYEAEEQTGGQG